MSDNFLTPLRSMRFLPRNLIELVHHFPFPHEQEIVKKTELFQALDDDKIQAILKLSKLVTYVADTVVFQEGEQADALYIIMEGSVRVFTRDMHNTKIALARLNKGDYFGEQALLGEANKTRNANIETITNTTLLKIPEKLISVLLHQDKALNAKLKRIGFEQALNTLTLTTGFYNEINNIISRIQNPTIREYSKHKTLFSFGDKADNVYMILQGEIELLIPGKGTAPINSVTLHRGQIFGELGVLQKKPRSATAIVQANARLLIFTANQFTEYFQQQPTSSLQDLLASFQHTYQLPKKGIVEQYIGTVPELGAVVTNVYKLNNGKSVISSRYLNQDIFMMSVVNASPGKCYEHKISEEHKIELYVAEQRLIMIKAFGWWDELPHACGLLLDEHILSAEWLTKFVNTGKIYEAQIDIGNPEEKICECMSVKRSKIQKLIDQGVKNFSVISEETGACTVCKCCKYRILEMLGEDPWLNAIMITDAVHAANVRSYIIKPTNGEIKSLLPGQHVVLQVKIDDNWLERAYTVSAPLHNNQLRVTIKKEPKGAFSEWLFERAPEQFNINVIQPQGDFTLKDDVTTPALCFAGGIGITPFVVYAKHLAAIKSSKPLHIVYCALSTTDLVLLDELRETAQLAPTITIAPKVTATDGLLTEVDIINNIESIGQPDIYICGPEGFVNLIVTSLKKINYNESKIHIERFAHAGASSTKNL